MVFIVQHIKLWILCLLLQGKGNAAVLRIRLSTLFFGKYLSEMLQVSDLPNRGHWNHWGNDQITNNISANWGFVASPLTFSSLKSILNKCFSRYYCLFPHNKLLIRILVRVLITKRPSSGEGNTKQIKQLFSFIQDTYTYFFVEGGRFHIIFISN